MVTEGRDRAAIDWTALRYVFVVTYARSGSTLLQSLLNSCPGVQIRGENSNTLYHLYQAIEGVEVTRKFGLHPQTKAADEPWFGAFQVRPRAFEANLLSAFVRNVLVPDAGIAVTGFKEIRYNHHFIPKARFAPYIEFLLTRFPAAKVVFNSRRAEDVARSAFLANQNQKNIADWVSASDSDFAEFAKGSDRAIHMRYDDWAADHGLIHGMLDFLGLKWTAETVEQVFAKPLTHGKDEALRG